MKKLVTCCLLFTLWSTVHSQALPPILVFKKSAYIFSDGTIVNYSFLKGLANTSGGQFFNINKTKPSDIAGRIGNPPFSYISATFDKDKIHDITPQYPEAVQKEFSLSGKLTAPEATITINYGINNQVLHSHKFRISQKDATSGSMVRTYWALRELNELLLFPKKNEQAITVLGKMYGLVTPNTSLIVLDSLDQYLEHEIRPPDSLPEMQKQYDSRIVVTKKQETDQKKQKLERVIRLWERRKQWWNKDFNVSKIKRYIPPAKLREERLGRRVERAKRSASAWNMSVDEDAIHEELEGERTLDATSSIGEPDAEAGFAGSGDADKSVSFLNGHVREYSGTAWHAGGGDVAKKKTSILKRTSMAVRRPRSLVQSRCRWTSSPTPDGPMRSTNLQRSSSKTTVPAASFTSST